MALGTRKGRWVHHRKTQLLEAVAGPSVSCRDGDHPAGRDVNDVAVGHGGVLEQTQPFVGKVPHSVFRKRLQETAGDLVVDFWIALRDVCWVTSEETLESLRPDKVEHCVALNDKTERTQVLTLVRHPDVRRAVHKQSALGQCVTQTEVSRGTKHKRCAMGFWKQLGNDGLKIARSLVGQELVADTVGDSFGAVDSRYGVAGPLVQKASGTNRNSNISNNL